MVENRVNNLNQVFDVLDNLDGGNHLVMFYEEPEYAHIVEYHFIKTGLKKGESCVYTTHVGDDDDDDDDIIEQSMTKFGITVEKYEKNHVLNMRMMTHTPADSKGLRQRT